MTEKKERIPCIKPDCKGDLNPLFEKHLLGYCMPCFDAIEKAAKEQYIKANIKDLNPYEGMADPVEILLTLLNYQQFHDPLINLITYPKTKFELVAEMTTSELARLSQRLVERLLSKIQRTREHAVEVVNIIAGLTNFDLEPLLLLLLDVPESGDAIFRRSGSIVINELFSRLNQGDSEALRRLAFIDDEEVPAKLISLQNESGNQIEDFREALKNAAIGAGWELTPDNRKRHLYYQQSRTLNLTEPNSAAEARLELYTDAHLACPMCKGPLLLQANLAPQIVEKLLGTSLAETDTPFYYCNQCSLCTDELFCEINSVGQASWHKGNYIKYPPIIEPDSLAFEDLPYKNLSFRAGSELQDPFLYSEFLLDGLTTHNSKFGGAPDWLQNCDYPTCPDCQRLMKFVFQIDTQGLDIFELDSHYAFFCDLCRSFTATVRQCT